MDIYLKNSFLIQTDLTKLQLVSKKYYKYIETLIQVSFVKFESWEEEPTAFY